MREEFDRKPGLNPAAWKYGVGWIDGPLQRQPHQIFVVNGGHAWHMDGPGGAPVASTPDLAEIYQLDMWLNPHGFLKAARLPGANPRAAWRWELGEMGRDGPEVTPEKSHRRVDHGQWASSASTPPSTRSTCSSGSTPGWPIPVLGDMNYEHEFTNDELRRPGQRHPVPDRLAFASGWDDNYGALSRSAGHNAFGGTLKNIKAERTAPTPSPRPTRCARRRSDPASRRASWPTASTCSVAAPTTAWPSSSRTSSPCSRRRSSEARSLAVIDEIVRLIPGKPIRLADQLPSALRSHRRASRLHPHRRDDRHAHHELRFLQARRS